MSTEADRAVAIVGVGAILPDAMSAPAYWQNICNKRYSITDVPADRWSVADYYDPDPSAPYKTYSKIGGWVQGFEFNWKRFRIPPRVAEAMDESQKWAVTIAAEALADYGHPDRPLNTERTGVILGTAMGGERTYATTTGISFPEFLHALEAVDEFSQLSATQRDAILTSWEQNIRGRFPIITEDTMPGELPNIVSGRVANVLNLRGPNFITDAACASSFAAVNSAVEMLIENHVDAVLAGGVDRMMSAADFIKFCKIGALSATGSRPFGEGADGFVMGEGSGSFLLKRLADAERDGDKIYAVIRGVGGASDGKGKGITAPNPRGQTLAIERAWHNAGMDPATATLVEAHGTSTKVGDVVEAESLMQVFAGAPTASIALGSAKSNVGHLKAGAGAAGLLKATMALYEKKLPPTLSSERPNPNFDFSKSPFFLNHELRDWEQRNGTPRRVGVSAYGFGGTNFHLVLEEHIPGMLTTEKKQYSGATVGAGQVAQALTLSARAPKPPIRGILVVGAKNPNNLKTKMDEVFQRVHGGWMPPKSAPSPADLSAPERLVIDFGDHDELEAKVAKARKAAGFDNPAAWKALQAQGIFRGSGEKPGKIGFLFPGQGSQYPNMGRQLAGLEPVVKQVFDDADAVMTPILGKPLTDYIFVDGNDPAAMKEAGMALMQTAITQPAMLTMDTAIYKLLGEYGVHPDMVMGHSLGEYGALIAAGIMPFAHALEASAARGAEMTRVSMEDNGWMAAVFAPYAEVEQILGEIDGYVVAANINSYSQSVIGGASKAVEEAIGIFTTKGYRAVRIPVSHAFHTSIVAPASAPLRTVLDRLSISKPKLPLVANVTGEFYPTTVEGIKDSLELQIASPVQWVKGLETMYANGVRTFIEVGPKKALKGFVDDVLCKHDDIWSLFTNHPKMGELPTFNQALCGLYAAGYGVVEEEPILIEPPVMPPPPVLGEPPVMPPELGEPVTTPPIPGGAADLRSTNYAVPNEDATSMSSNGQMNSDALGQALVQALQQLNNPAAQALSQRPYDRNDEPLGSVVVTGTGLGLPGADKPLMDPDNALRILNGEQFIDLIPEQYRKDIAAKRITRLVKGEDGSGRFETISDTAEVIKLAGRPGSFDLTEEYGVPAKLVEALDTTTQMAMAAGLDTLREAGIPLIQTYRKTRKGTYLPEKWLLPEPLRDETGIIFASAFPGGDRFAEELSNYFKWENRSQQLEALEDLRAYVTDDATAFEINRRLTALREEMAHNPYTFDRRFLFRILAMGHSQFAEYIGARGPNTHVNAACASTAQGVALAEDWIRSGRCRRVIVVGGDNVTGEHLMEWVGAGFLAVGAAATDDKVEEAALPFDRRRHGTILGMGACALVVESEDATRERGYRGITELLSSETANSAFHGTRLDVNHISDVMGRLVTAAERRFGLSRYSMAPRTVFVSHETFTPARGGSAAAEVTALRNTFGDATNDIIMANTKGFTGHPMGVGVEDVIAVKILEYGIVPPVPNFREVDPELGLLNLSRGGRYPVQYALHLAAGFGSQISLTLMRRIPGGLDRVDNPGLYRRWLADVSGLDSAETEVVKRVLRIQANGTPGRTPIANIWRYGVGPSVRITMSGGAEGAAHPARMIAPSVVDRSAAPAAPAAPAPVVPAAPKPAPVPTPPPAPRTVVAPAPAAVLPVEPPPVVAPTQAPAPTPAIPAPQAPITPAPVADPVVSKVLTIVAEKTGYPEDMLDLDLDMEADLGIDTVKQAETFTAIREAFDIPVREDLSLRDYPTLEKVVGFVHEMRPELAVATPIQTRLRPRLRPSTPQAPTTPTGDVVAAKVLAIVADKTGYPEDMLDLDLDMEADLGIDTVKQAETFGAVREAFEIPLREDLSLRDYPTLEAVIGYVHEMRPDLAAAPAALAAPAAPAPQVPQVPTTPAVDEVTAKVLAIVADKTGYPEDMLDLDLDMEADLGIDTVKQAETFGAVREAFDIPLREDLSLRDYPTLEAVIGYVHTMRPDLAVAAAPATPAAPAAPVPQVPTTPAVDEVTAKVLAIVADKTGYPEDMLDLDLDMEADLGIDTVKQAETFGAVREAFDIPLREDLSLRDYPTLEAVIGYVHTMRPDLVVAAPAPAPAAPAPAAPVIPVDPAPQAPATPTVEDEVAAKVLAIVAEKTGYPEDMLELDLDMEADLGIDTVKQAETFAAVRETFDIPLREDLSLRDYPTLESVIGFVREMRPDLVVAAAPVAPAPQAPSTPTADDVTAKVLAIVADKTGYPEDMLELDLDMEADLGIDTVKQAETFAAVRETFDIPLREDLSLRDYPTLESVIGFVREMRPDLASTAAATPEPQTPTAPAAGDAVTAKVLAIVADKTGYPEDMLELDLDMEADLGIDTVKQAETFAAVREVFDIPLREDLSLRDYPTLESVIGFVNEMRPDLASSGGEVSSDVAAPTAPTSQAPIAPAVAVPKPIGTLEDADKMPRRVPTPMLRPALDLCKPTGVTLDAESRAVVMMDQSGVGKSLVNRLEKRGVTVLTLEPGIDTDAMNAHLEAWLAEGPIKGIYWLPALDIETAIEEMDLADWREQNRRRAKNLYSAMRTLYDAVAGPGTFLISATRLGGLHGYGAEAATAPLGGAVSGFTKAYNIEQGMRPEGNGVLVKVVDFAVSRKTAEPADLLIAETLTDAGLVEVGYSDGQRFAITLTQQPAADGQSGMTLDEHSVFVVTGAAGGITSAIVTDLAVAFKGIFYLLDLVEAPARDDANIALFRTDKDGLKRKLIEDARARGERPTPVVIDKEIMAIERSEAALRAIETVEAAGGTCHYRNVNLMDADAVGAIVSEIRADYGRIDVLLHAGGLLIDRTLPTKEPQQFALVFDVKADGFFNLINAAKGMHIGATISFSSVAGRFGNNGQSDYSSANDLLCKISSSMRSWRPATRAIAIDWTAWGEIGMAARGSVPTVMAALGIDMLPPESGVPTIRRELTYGGTRGEVLVAGRLGAWLEEDDPEGGLDVVKANAVLASQESQLPMIGEIKAAKLYGGMIAEATLDPTEQPFLFDHKVEDDLPWLPGVMGTEGLVELAALIAPGYRVVGVENQENLGALKFHRDGAKTIRISTVVTPDANGDLLAMGRLQSIFQPPKPELPPQIKDHFAATVRLSKTDAGEAPTEDFSPPAEMPIDAVEVYEVFFHGPAYQVIEKAVVDGNTAVALLAADLGPNASPADAVGLTAPRTLEHMVQTAALWSTKTNNAMALPAGFDSVSYYRNPEDAESRLYAMATTANNGETYEVQLVDESGMVYVELNGYRTVLMAL